MLKTINKIIIQLNSIDEANILLKKGISLADKYHAIVEILYVHESPLFDIPDYFRHKSTKELDKEKIKSKIQTMISELNTSIEPAIFVNIDDTEDRLWALVRDDNDTIIITTYHDKITRKIINKIEQPILIIKTEIDSYQKAAILLNTSEGAIECIDSIKSYLRDSDIQLLYDYKYIIEPDIELDLQNVQIIEQAQREAFEKIKQKSDLSGEFFIDGNFFDDDLIDYLQKKSFDIVILCANKDDFFTADTISEELLAQLNHDLMIINN